MRRRSHDQVSFPRHVERRLSLWWTNFEPLNESSEEEENLRPSKLLTDARSFSYCGENLIKHCISNSTREYASTALERHRELLGTMQQSSN